MLKPLRIGEKMALKINETCIACGACEAVCPVEAISQGEEYYVIDPDTCVECEGYFDEPQCKDVCPTDSIEKD
jgi:ferredoxin